jgi:hypothetical protein
MGDGLSCTIFLHSANKSRRHSSLDTAVVYPPMLGHRLTMLPINRKDEDNSVTCRLVSARGYSLAGVSTLVANYVLIVDLRDSAGPTQYETLTRLMRDFGFISRSPETLRPAQFSITSALPLSGLKRMVEDRIKAELQANVFVDAYEIKQLGTPD